MKFFAFLVLIALSAIMPIAMVPADAYHDDRTSRGSSDPRIALNGNDAYVVWLESIDPEFGDVYFTKITDGKIVEESINITKGTSFYPRPQIHVAENNVYLLWEDKATSKGDDQIFFAKSNDYGKTFSEPKTLPANNQSIYRPSSVHQVNDVVYVFGSNWNRDTQQNNIIFVTSDDFGDTFSEPTVLFNHEQSDQEIRVQVYDNTIYILSDDRKDFDEKGALYLRKILPDGTLTDIVNVNGGKTTVTYPQFAVLGDNVYVSWRDRVNEKGDFGITERWYQVFTKSHDGGNTFDKVITFDSDPEAIDTTGVEGEFIFAHEDSVYVLWKSEYWDGETQEFKTYLAYSNNKGEDFVSKEIPLDDKLFKHGYITSILGNNNLHQIAITTKNPPYDDAAVYFSTMGFDLSTKPVDILKDISVQVGWMPSLASNENRIHFVAEGNHNKNCILYSFSDDEGKSFSDVVNISPNGNDFECLGVKPNILAPLKQVMAGVDYFDIQCKDDSSIGYILSLRERDGHPVCVTTDSYDNLVNRGWLLHDAQETLSLQAAKKFIQSGPTFSSGGVDGSVDLNIVNVRKSIPPIVTINGTFTVTHAVEIPRDGPLQSISETPETKYVSMQIAQINKIHLAIIDEEWDEINENFVDNIPRQETFHNYSPGPTSRMILTIGDAINNRGMIPITITEISENVTDTVTFWQFQPIKHDGDNRGKTWDFLPDSYRQGWGFFDENGNDAWDDSKIPRDHYGIPADGHGYPVFCGNERINGESAHPSGIPIKPGLGTIIVKSGQLGYLPDSDGTYTIRFVSLFETDVEFPNNAQIIENETMLCIMENTREDATHAYYTKLQFKIDDSWTASYYLPGSDVSSGNIHEHATILAKIFGDKFDFTHADFQLQDPRINFEPTEPNLIHRMSDGATIGFLFETLEMKLSSQCFVFSNGREFCNNDESELKFYINGQKKDDITEYVLFDDDRILISYGSETEPEIVKQLEELESIAKYNYLSIENLMILDVGTVREGTYNADLGFKTAEKLMRMEMKRHAEDTLEKNLSQYTSEEMFERISEIEAENIKMYKLGPEEYEIHVAAKKLLEQGMKESIEWDSSFIVQINPETKSLEVVLPKHMESDAGRTIQLESLIEGRIQDDISWSIIFSEQ